MNNEQIVLVTGSSKGIGLSIAKKFKEAKWVVIQNSRSEILEDSLIGDISIIADVTKSDDVISLVKNIKDVYGHLDAIVCNVGSGKNIESSISQDRWDHFIRMNLFSASNIIDHALPLLNNSSVTVISSICADAVIDGAPVEYSTAKAALNQYIKVMAKKYAKSEIRFNSVSPGNVMFDGSQWAEKLKLDEKNTINHIREKVPMGKFIEPQDIAEMAYYLSSIKSRFITGQNFVIDGGQSL
jgi:3-oxoacyl-[acyl-carrier protein] reductase